LVRASSGTLLASSARRTLRLLGGALVVSSVVPSRVEMGVRARNLVAGTTVVNRWWRSSLGSVEHRFARRERAWWLAVREWSPVPHNRREPRVLHPNPVCLSNPPRGNRRGTGLGDRIHESSGLGISLGFQSSTRTECWSPFWGASTGPKRLVPSQRLTSLSLEAPKAPSRRG
jgi:hypothetical protein